MVPRTASPAAAPAAAAPARTTAINGVPEALAPSAFRLLAGVPCAVGGQDGPEGSRRSGRQRRTVSHLREIDHRSRTGKGGGAGRQSP